MGTTLKLGDIVVEVLKKDIKNVHLSVLPPTGRVRLSAPTEMSAAAIRLFAIAKLGWIKARQRELLGQERESQREYVDRESHYVWGRRHLLKVVEVNDRPTVQAVHGSLVLKVRSESHRESREAVVASWYRQLLKDAVSPLVKKWEPRLGVTVRGVFVQRMRTKWGSCNPVAGTIRINTELAKKPRESLEYIVVHEMAHLLERKHNARFTALLDRALPDWRHHRTGLNALPLRHERWDC